MPTSCASFGRPGVSDFKGDYYQMEDCRVRPVPEGEMKIICAGSSDEGLAFSAQYADYAFCLGKGVNTPTAFASNNERLMAATAKTGRDVRIYALFMVIAAETDEEAMEKWISYREGVDEEAVAWLGFQGAADKTSSTTNVRQLADKESAVNFNMGTLVGSYENVARMLDEALDGAEHWRSAADVRRLHRGDGEVRHPDPAADEVPEGMMMLLACCIVAGAAPALAPAPEPTGTARAAPPPDPVQRPDHRGPAAH